MPTLRVAAFQGSCANGNITQNFNTLRDCVSRAARDRVDILLMPECFLTGYFESFEDAFIHSIDLASWATKDMFLELGKWSSPTIILGLNERDDQRIFNTAVVIEHGCVVGKYRKAYTYAPYDYYSTGSDFPIFEKNGIPYGIVICYDIMYREPALITSLKGARFIFCPMNNKVPTDSPMLPHLSEKQHLTARAFDSNCWLICSDVVIDTPPFICPGSATIIDSNGSVHLSTRPFQTELISMTIDVPNLNLPRKKRWNGSPHLAKQLAHHLGIV